MLDGDCKSAIQDDVDCFGTSDLIRFEKVLDKLKSVVTTYMVYEENDLVMRRYQGSVATLDSLSQMLRHEVEKRT